MTEFLVCSRCEGLIPTTADACPHCERRGPWRRLAETTLGGALAVSLMACYGAAYPMPGPMTGPDETCSMDGDGDGDGFCQEDCDDTNRDVHPGAEDIPGDGIDQDCDGQDAVGDVVLEQDSAPDAPAPDPQMADPEEGQM